MPQKAKPTIAFLTGQWLDIDNRIRCGQTPGGVPSVARIWTQCLDKGFDVHVFIVTPTESGWPDETIELNGVNFHWIRPFLHGWGKWLNSHGLLIFFRAIIVMWQWQMLWRICRIRVRPDIIYAMRNTYGILAFVWSFLVGAKCVVRQYGVSPIYHAWFEQKRWLPRIRSFPAMLISKIPMDLFIVTNDGSRGDLVASWLGIPPERHKFWLNGVNKSLHIPNFDAGAFKQTIGMQPDTPLLMTLGRLCQVNRQDRAIDAMAVILRDFPKAQLVLVGGGEMRVELEERTRQLGIANSILFVGAISHDQIKYYLNSADVFLQLNDITNLRNTLIEALTAGCCVTTIDVGATGLVATHDDNAVVLKTGSVELIAEAAIDLLNDPGKRNSLSRAAHQRAMRDFQTWDERMAMEMTCLEELIGMSDSDTTSEVRNPASGNC